MTQTSNSKPNCNNCTISIKFLYSYNGQILPRRSDGAIRYIGGHTRILSVDRSISFAELLVKFGELTGTSMNLKCKLPNGDLDVLVSINSDEELKNIIDEYDRVSEVTRQDLKIRAVLFPVKSLKKISPPSSPMSRFNFHTPSRIQPTKFAPAANFPSLPSLPVTQTSFQPTRTAPRNNNQSQPYAAAYRCFSPPVGYPAGAGVRKLAGTSCCVPRASSRLQYVVPYSNNF